MSDNVRHTSSFQAKSQRNICECWLPRLYIVSLMGMHIQWHTTPDFAFFGACIKH